MWRYATLCVLSKMYRKLLFNNLSIVWNIRIQKSKFSTFVRFVEKKITVGRNGLGLYHEIQHNSVNAWI